MIIVRRCPKKVYIFNILAYYIFVTAPAKQTFFKDRVEAPVVRQMHDDGWDLVLQQLGHGDVKVHLLCCVSLRNGDVRTTRQVIRDWPEETEAVI